MNGVTKTYGTIIYDPMEDVFSITEAQPHICIKLKSVFEKIKKTHTVPFKFKNTGENCFNLLWFMERYPLAIEPGVEKLMVRRRRHHINDVNEREKILTPEYVPKNAALREGEKARDYQLKARDLFMLNKRMLLGDDMGLGKTLSAILCALEPKTSPTAIVMQAHLPFQWENEIMRFTNLTVHLIKKNSAYTLPPADVYIFKYTSMSGWVDFFRTGYFKMAIFDECQELRNTGSEKYNAAAALSESVEYCLMMSGTPIYNYGIEIFNIVNVLNKGILGTQAEFMREWCPGGKIVTDPQALGSYLRESFIMLRRTRQEVGRELPVVNKLIYEVGYDSKEVKKVEELATKLALSTLSGSFMERGEAARELDVRLRHMTGVSKAREVASWVRMFLENGEPVVLAGWHRDVYDIWMKELAEFNPVLYTGSESPKQKDDSVSKFIAGGTKLFIISLRSGIGLDGLQKICKTVIHGELDWSPKVHDQLTTRVDRDGQQEEVTSIYLISDFGSDPTMVDILGLKSSQSHGIIDPMLATTAQYSDESRIKILARRFLAYRNIKVEESGSCD